MKDYLRDQLTGLHKIEEKITLQVIYTHPRTNWDIGNKANLWAKIFEDLIKGEYIVDDSVKYLGNQILDSELGPHGLTINIYKYDKVL